MLSCSEAPVSGDFRFGSVDSVWWSESASSKGMAFAEMCNFSVRMSEVQKILLRFGFVFSLIVRFYAFCSTKICCYSISSQETTGSQGVMANCGLPSV